MELAQTAEKPPSDSEKPASWWEKIINTTPVVLTVVATILAGLSSSEMNLAQYHRSVAAQNQSKAGDQWAFFQAKRIRQDGMENTAALLSGITGASPAGASSLQQLTDLPQRLQLATSETRQALLSAATEPARDESNSPAAQFAHETTRQVDEAQSLASEARTLLGTPDAAVAEKYLAGGLPAVTDKRVEDPKIIAALQAIDAGDEQQAAALLRQIRETDIQQALAIAQGNADAFDRAAKPIGQTIDRLSSLAAREAGVVRAFIGSSDLLISTPAGQPAAPARATAAQIKSQAENLAGELITSHLGYAARRNAAEGRYNQAIARLYELQVRFSSGDSERHRDRSKFFFYGMLAAQAGVTISTLSLAVKRRSLLWALASLVGLAAVVYAGYIYLFT